MENLTCSIESCDTSPYTRGYCRPHYRRLLKYGNPLAMRQLKPQLNCTIDGCEKKARTKTSALCEMHYHRRYRGGEVGSAAEKIRKQRNPECAIEGCSKPDKEAGLCHMHGARKRRHGDPMVVIPLEERAFHYGEDHHNWVGEDVRYESAHQRVVRLHGPASIHLCVDCDQPAYHWSYNHDDPNQKYELGRSARPVAYSDKPEHYSPRCVPCHKRFDLDRINGTQVFETGAMMS